MVDVQFLDDMRRRTSLIHGAFLELGQADVATGAMAAAAAQGAVPEGVHALELLYVTAPRHKMSVDMMDDMAARVRQWDRAWLKGGGVDSMDAVTAGVRSWGRTEM